MVNHSVEVHCLFFFTDIPKKGGKTPIIRWNSIVSTFQGPLIVSLYLIDLLMPACNGSPLSVFHKHPYMVFMYLMNGNQPGQPCYGILLSEPITHICLCEGLLEILLFADTACWK